MTRAVVALLLVACGGGRASEPPPSGPPIDTVTITTTTAAEACTGPCSEGAAPCERDPAWRCECTLHADVNCGGAARATGPGWWAWSCAPIDPEADRGDGCPFAQPIEGAACGAERSCRYAQEPCQWNGVDAACTGGVWHLTAWAMPPPP